MHPLRDAFAAISFFAFGLSIDPGDIVSVAGPVTVAAALTVVMNVVAGLLVARVYRYGTEPAAEIATTLVARGESALILAAMAAGAGLDARLAPFIAGYVLVLAILGPIAAGRAHLLARALRAAQDPGPAAPPRRTTPSPAPGTTAHLRPPPQRCPPKPSASALPAQGPRVGSRPSSTPGFLNISARWRRFPDSTPGPVPTSRARARPPDAGSSGASSLPRPSLRTSLANGGGARARREPHKGDAPNRCVTPGWSRGRSAGRTARTSAAAGIVRPVATPGTPSGRTGHHPSSAEHPPYVRAFVGGCHREG